jgi:hypothetical protein
MAERRLTRRESERLLVRMQLAARPGPGWAQSWDAWERQCGQRECRVEFPLGELTNTAIAGFAWAWAVSRRLTTHAIQGGDRFDVQCLEGKARVITTLTTALLVYRELPPYRCQIWEIIPVKHIRRSIHGRTRQAGYAARAAPALDVVALV